MYRTRTLLFRSLLGSFLCALFFAPSFVFAQTPPATQSYQDLMDQLLNDRTQAAAKQTELQKSTVGAYLDVKVFPATPGPDESVQITIDSYLTDLYKARITWSLNGTVLLRGLGKTTFTFQNGPSGQTTYVSLSFTTNTGEIVTKDFSFTPVGVTIMWEADTYTPPFYKGKALLSPEATVRVIATPDITTKGSPFGAGNLVYSWKKDDYPASTGYSKNVYSFISSKPLNNTKITLDVSSVDDSSQSEMQIYLPLVHPFILFYEKDPLLGVQYNKPFDTETTLNKKEFSISAEPYFFSNESTESGSSPTIRYTWSVNGKDIQNSGRTITLRNDTGVDGSSLISLSMRGIIKTFQSASKDLQVNFKSVNSSSLPLF